MPTHVTRIISDLHFDDGSSHLSSLAMLRPLLDGADRLIVNGDALDTQVISDAAEVVAHFRDFCATHIAETTFLTGNHDPDIAAAHELSLADGLIWITHGDVLFDDIAPWSPIRAELHRRVTALNAGLTPTQRAHIETRLRLHRQACLKLPREHDPRNRTRLYRMKRLARVLFPPRQPLAMISAWRSAPRRAAELAATQRPRARFILMGHTHFPGIWSEHGPHVYINTGSFCPPRGGFVAEIRDDQLRVRRIVRRGDAFHPGETLAEFPLAEPPRGA